MDVFLINPPTVNKLTKAIGRLPMIGLSYLNSYIRAKGFQSEVIDCDGENITNLEASIIAKRKKPRLVGISSTTPLIERAVDLAMKIKNIMPSVKIVLGGSHATELGRDVLEDCKSIDMVVKGEGEETLHDIVTGLQNGHPNLDKIKGLVYRRGGKIFENSNRSLIENLDSLPHPSRALVGNTNYVLSLKWYYRQPFATMVTSRGCHFPCEFCDVQNMFGRKIRYRSVNNVIKEIQILSSDYGAKEIIFYDDVFALNKKRVLEICERIINEKLDITWGCYSRADVINEEMAKVMKKAGCHMVSLGIESGSQIMLDKMKKGIKLDEARQAVAILRKNDIETNTSFVIGYPGETRETIRETDRFVKDINPTFVAYFRLISYPGISLYNDYLEQENLHRLSIAQFKGLGCDRVLRRDTMEEKEIREIINVLYRSFYARPKKLIQHLLRTFSLFRIKAYINALI